MSWNHEGSRLCKGHVGDKNYRKLQRSVSRIKKNLDVESVLDDLISAEVLSIEDGVDIRHEKKPHAMADVLIQKLIYVGEHGYSIFENVLRKHGYGYLVDNNSGADNIPLSQPIQYTGHSSKLTAWYPTMHMDPNLSQFPGCHPDVDERKIKSIVRENKDREGSYVIWYSTKRKLLIITVIKKESPKGRYHYKVKCRKLEPEQEMIYRFSSQKETKSVVELLEYVKLEGLPPPVEKAGCNSK